VKGSGEGDLVPTGFVFLESYHEALRGLPDTSRLQMLDAILGYVFDGVIPQLSPELASLWVLIRPNVDASMRRYQASVENGKKGGRPPKPKGT